MRIVLMLLCYMGLTGQAVHAAPVLSYRVVRTEAHDSSSFTQGLAVDGNQLIEGTGLYGRSRLTVRDRSSGKLLHVTTLSSDEFGEGVAVVGERIVQLTWMNAVGYVYDRRLKRIGKFPLQTEGWGLAYDGHRLVLSDGSSRLQFLDPVKFVVDGSIEVRDEGRHIDRLNELEVVDGLIFANIWQSDRIAIIDSQSGVVQAWLDLKDLRSQISFITGDLGPDSVLNGIALVPESGHLLVTGKCWPTTFEIAVDLQSLRAAQQRR